MSGTTGLGQNQQVFNFDGIAELGLQIDAMQEAKREKKSQKFQQKFGKKLSEDPQISMVRDVDKAYLNGLKEEYMNAATQAQMTENPADAQKAIALQQELSRQIAESQTVNELDYKAMEAINASDDPAYYQAEWNKRRQETALSKDKNFIGREDAYSFIPKKDIVDGSLYDIALKDVGLVREMGTYSHTDAEGKSVKLWQEGTAREKANALYDNYTANNQLAQELNKEAFFQERFGNIDRFTNDDVAKMNNMMAQSEEIREKYGSLAELENDPMLKTDPAAMRSAKELFNLPTTIDNFAREKFVSTAVERAEFRSEVREAKESSGGGNPLTNDMALSSGNSLLQAVPNLEKATLPEGFNANQKFGYASVPKLELKDADKGEFNRIVRGTLVDAEGREYAIVAKPDPKSIEKLVAASKIDDDVKRERVMLQLMSQQYTQEVVPITQAQSYVGANRLNMSLNAAYEQAGVKRAEQGRYGGK